MSLVNLQKRLEIIQILIQLSDIKSIRPHIFSCANEIKNFPTNSFLFLLENNDLKKLGKEVTTLIQKIDMKKIDPLTNLNKLITKLESDIYELEKEKIEISNKIENFDKRYHVELGKQVLKVAYFEQMKLNSHKHKTYTKKEILTKQPQKNETQLNRDEFEILLKQQFRKASKLCHPDSNEKASLENTNNYFIQLQKHLNNKNLFAINKLIEELEPYQNTSVINNETREQYKLEKEIQDLQTLKMKYINEIDFLKSTSSYQTISEYENIDIYFEEQKSMLNSKLDGFQQKFA